MNFVYVDAIASDELTVWEYALVGENQRGYGSGEVQGRINGLAPAIMAALRTLVDIAPTVIFVPDSSVGNCTKEDWRSAEPLAYLRDVVQYSDTKFMAVHLTSMSEMDIYRTMKMVRK